MPEQPAPVVNVAAPNVENNVTVQPAKVVLPKPTSASVIRDVDGRMVGIKTEGK
jgi:hypothetical protein